MTMIYKILAASIWQQAEASGTFLGAGIDLVDGYIHFSTADQVRQTAALHFAGQNDLVLVAVDSDRLGSALVFEPSRGGQLFPHLYGHLAVDIVAYVHPLALGPDGVHQFPVL